MYMKYVGNLNSFFKSHILHCYPKNNSYYIIGTNTEVCDKIQNTNTEVYDIQK